jgi:hypothetical protein
VGQEDLLIIYLKYLMKRKLRSDRVTEITYAPGADVTVAAEESKEELMVTLLRTSRRTSRMPETAINCWKQKR